MYFDSDQGQDGLLGFTWSLHQVETLIVWCVLILIPMPIPTIDHLRKAYVPIAPHDLLSLSFPWMSPNCCSFILKHSTHPFCITCLQDYHVMLSIINHVLGYFLLLIILFYIFSSNSNTSLHSASQNYLKCLEGSTISMSSKICINSSQAWKNSMQLWQSKKHIHFKMSFRVVSLIGSRKDNFENIMIYNWS